MYLLYIYNYIYIVFFNIHTFYYFVSLVTVSLNSLHSTQTIRQPRTSRKPSTAWKTLRVEVSGGGRVEASDSMQSRDPTRSNILCQILTNASHGYVDGTPRCKGKSSSKIPCVLLRTM